MFAATSQCTRPAQTPARLCRRVLLLLLTFSLLTGPLAAQTDAETKRAAAQQLINEGVQLRAVGTKEALEATIGKFTAALPLYRALGDTAHEAVTLGNIGVLYYTLGEKQKALDCFRQALPLAQADGDRQGEAMTRQNIGQTYAALDEPRQALPFFTQALALYRALGDRATEATLLQSIGGLYDLLGERQQALANHTQALALRRALGDRATEAMSLNSVGHDYSALGEKQKALDYYTQALALFRAVADRRGEATTLSNLGAVYQALGEPQQALAYVTQALPLFHALGDQRGEATTLDTLGVIYHDAGEGQKTFDHYTQALRLFRAVGDRQSEAVMLSNIGRLYDARGEHQQALNYLTQALALSRALGDRASEAFMLNDIGVAYAALGEQQQALAAFTQALALRRAVGDRSGEAVTLGAIAYMERNRGHLGAARDRIEEALKIIESLRTKIASQALRASYFETTQGNYEFYIDLLMRLHRQQPGAGYDGAALQASERGRARSLLELLTEAGADIRQGVDPQLVARERAAQQQLNAGAQRQLQLLSGPHTDEQAEATAREIARLAAEFQQVEAQIRQTSPRYATLTQPAPLTLRELQTQLLDADTMLLEYSLGKERSYLWAVTPTAVTSYELPKREEVEAAAGQFYKLLTARPPQASVETLRRGPGTAAAQRAGAQLAQAAAQLSRTLLAPVAPLLGKKRLLVVADGALQYVPFAALPVPAGAGGGAGATSGAGAAAGTPLVVEHEIVSLPSASTLAVLRREAGAHKGATKTLAVLADPVFEHDDERLTARVGQMGGREAGPGASAEETRNLVLGAAAKQTGVAAKESGGAEAGGLRIPRLRGTRREAEAIAALVPAGQRKEALDFAASRALAVGGELGAYRFVHFATHGLLNSERPELSGVVLSLFDERGAAQDGFLRLHEIFNLKLNADVVVLSACQTGLGKDVRGEGLVGLTRGFMYAGAPRVVVSLWNVDDAATAELMARFYRGMLVERLRPAEALRRAQVALLKEARYGAPYYWAAFTLQGEWR
ncbi:MAG TPA: CHAT domain-containing protein [Pyrinomonadaceae bacterium]|jgi:tetratricopeptide (TPR) repeat protein